MKRIFCENAATVRVKSFVLCPEVVTFSSATMQANEMMIRYFSDPDAKDSSQPWASRFKAVAVRSGTNLNLRDPSAGYPVSTVAARRTDCSVWNGLLPEIGHRECSTDFHIGQCINASILGGYILCCYCTGHGRNRAGHTEHVQIHLE